MQKITDNRMIHLYYETLNTLTAYVIDKKLIESVIDEPDTFNQVVAELNDPVEIYPATDIDMGYEVIDILISGFQ